jgi:CII-binding regulator of phage lambda lysogenization HflD
MFQYFHYLHTMSKYISWHVLILAQRFRSSTPELADLAQRLAEVARQREAWPLNSDLVLTDFFGVF